MPLRWRITGWLEIFWLHFGLAIVSTYAGQLPDGRSALKAAPSDQANISVGYVEVVFTSIGSRYRSYLVDGLHKLGLSE